MESRPPAWMESLVDTVGDCLEVYSEAGPLTFRWGQEDDLWRVMVYLAPVELVGGASDGAMVYPSFSLDLQELTSALDETAAVRWHAHSLSNHDFAGPHIAVEGTYQGRYVYLQVLSDAPEDEGPGHKVNCS